LQDFGVSFWKLYHDCLEYREHSDPKQAVALEAAFDQLFGEQSGYQALDECKKRTLAKKEALLMVLSHPEILLHNNPAELGARQRVRKRDVSLQARTPEGIEAWDQYCELKQHRGPPLALEEGDQPFEQNPQSIALAKRTWVAADCAFWVCTYCRPA
jgi:Transposase IS66 family